MSGHLRLQPSHWVFGALVAFPNASHAFILDPNKYCGVGFDLTRPSDTDPGSLPSVNDVALWIGSISKASNCYPAFDPGNSTPSNETRAINQIFGDVSGPNQFVYLDKIGAPSNPDGRDGIGSPSRLLADRMASSDGGSSSGGIRTERPRRIFPSRSIWSSSSSVAITAPPSCCQACLFCPIQDLASGPSTSSPSTAVPPRSTALACRATAATTEAGCAPHTGATTISAAAMTATAGCSRSGVHCVATTSAMFTDLFSRHGPRRSTCPDRGPHRIAGLVKEWLIRIGGQTLWGREGRLSGGRL